jgi:CRP-like cAMP-binding protein
MRSIVEKVILLQRVDVFADVPTEPLSVLAASADEVNVLEGDAVYREGERADALYLVLDGRIRLHQGERAIGEVGPGEAFGTWALFDEEPRLGDATALESSALLRIDREEFIDLMADHVQIAQGVIRAVSRRLRALAERSAG